MIEAFITGAVGAAIVAVLGNVVMFKLQRKAAKEDKSDLKLIERIESQEKEQSVMKAGLEALLHDRLYERCTDLLAQKSITVSELKNIEYIYRSYHDLGGNGTGTQLFERIQTLPLSEERGGINEEE